MEAEVLRNKGCPYVPGDAEEPVLVQKYLGFRGLGFHGYLRAVCRFSFWVFRVEGFGFRGLGI